MTQLICKAYLQDEHLIRIDTELRQVVCTNKFVIIYQVTQN